MPRKRLNADRYANRSDLQAGAGQGAAPVAQSAPQAQAVRAPTGLPYGQHAQLERAQQAVPLPQQAQAPAVPGYDGALRAALAAPPPQLVSLRAPSMRPNEPTTAGLPSGAGPGPEILASARRPAKVSGTYMALYEQTRDERWLDLANAAFARGQ